MIGEVKYHITEAALSLFIHGLPSIHPHCVIIVVLAAWCQITGLSLNERLVWMDRLIVERAYGWMDGWCHRACRDMQGHDTQSITGRDLASGTDPDK